MKLTKFYTKITKQVRKHAPFILIAAAIITISIIHVIGFAGSFIPQLFAGLTPQAHSAEVTIAAPITTATPKTIRIEKVGINLPIISVPLKNGTWQVHEGMANYAEGTSYISEKEGNVGIFAHDRANGFTRIKELAIGDTISITTTNGYIALYTITSKYDTMPSDVEVFYPTVKPTLTLVTCNGTFSDQRFIIKAELSSLKPEPTYDYAF